MLLSYQYEPEREREREKERMNEGADKAKRGTKRDAHLFDLYSISKPCKGSWSDKKKSDFASHTPSCGKTNYFFSAQKVVHASNLTFVAISV